MERLRSGDPEQIGPWQIVNRLGSGGMGIVYMGTNGTHAAAIKVVREFLLEDPASRTRLEREVDTLLRVKSEFVAEIVGSDVNGNPAWIATNYVDGPSLKVLIEKEGPLSEEKWIEFARGFLSALSSVHSVGVVHRDIKPSNILLTKSGPKLIDFGISFVNDATSLTGTGMVAGTPAWLAPEQFLGREITTSVDNFAAGSTLMYAATGKTPWGAEDSSVGAVMHTILVEEPDTSSLTEFQIEIITPLLIKDAQSRKTASQMLKKLNEGPKKLSLSTKRDQKQSEDVRQTSFLDKARKQDLADRKAKQEAQMRSEEESKKAAAKAQIEAEREQKRDKARQEKAAEKSQKMQIKASKRIEKAEARKINNAESATKEILREESSNLTSKKLGNRKILLPISVLLVLLLAIGIFAIQGRSDRNGTPIEPVKVKPKFTWSALIAGESETRTGGGTTFEIFVCDQYVIPTTVRIENISSRPKEAGLLRAKVLKGDARCGRDFDTIVVTGREAEQSGSVNYFVSGKTSSNFEFRYDFSVTILSN
jgi:serine/threonine protein kinase